MNSFNVCKTPIEHGLTLLEAGAGTGKTYSLVRIIARHLVEKNIPIDQILTVTFTRAATAEIKGRLHELLSDISKSLKNPDLDPKEINDLVAHWKGQESDAFLENARVRISTALANFDSVAIFTIDGFFQRLLKEFAFEANKLFSVELDTDEKTLIQTALRDYWRQHVYSLDAFNLKEFQNNVSFADTQRFLEEALRTPQAEFDHAYDQSVSAQMKPYLDLWPTFATQLKQHRDQIEDFLKNPPAGFKKGAYPFYGKGVPLTNQIDSILNHISTPQLNLGNLSKLSFSYLQSEAAFNKGKFVDLSGHLLADLFKAIDQLKALEPEQLKSAYYGEILRFVKSRLKQLKKERNVQSYTDVTNTLADIFTEHSSTSDSIKKSIKERFQAGLIDEFQDTSPQQCSVFLNLFHHSDRYFHIIGDPKQSIYRFRGADVFSYIAAKNEADHEHSLLTNYRSTPRMIHAVNEIFSLSADPFLVDQQITFSRAKWLGQNDATTPPEGCPAMFLHAVSPELTKADSIRDACYQNIAHETVKLLDQPWSDIVEGKSGIIKPSDIAVLVRTGKEGVAINKALSKLNIPVTLNTRTSLMESEETSELFCILSALLEPRKSDLLRTALLTTALGGGTLLLEQNDAEFDQITYQMTELHEKWQHHGLMPMMLDFVKQFDIRTTLLKQNQGQRRVTNFMHLIEMLDDKARTQTLTPTATVQWLEMAIQGSVIDMDSEVLELRIATDDAAVQIRTQHTSKGLEFPIVFVVSPCPTDLSYNTPNLSYHSPTSITPKFAAIDDTDSPIYELRKKESYADAARLAYVALTRAEYLCHFYLTPQNEKKPEEHAMYQMLGIVDQDQSQGKLLELADKSSGCIAYDVIEPDILEQATPQWTQKKDEASESGALTLRDTQNICITHNQRTTSFTGITRNAPDIIHDSDSYSDLKSPSGLTTPERQEESDFWAQLKAGASLGLVFHETLEEIDFQNTVGIESIILDKLQKYSPWNEEPKPKVLKTMIEEIKNHLQQWMSHPLGDGITLDQISHTKRLTEPEFLLSGTGFSIKSLCSILANNPPAHIPSYYIQQLQSIPASKLDGFLAGFIDLIFEHDGRYHLLDWKTNRLDNYSQNSIATSMADHHYYLQYHLYTLALDRFLAQRLGDNYNPAQHLGNTYYIYLRGIDPSTPGSGVFTDKITPNRLTALRAAFGRIEN